MARHGREGRGEGEQGRGRIGEENREGGGREMERKGPTKMESGGWPAKAWRGSSFFLSLSSTQLCLFLSLLLPLLLCCLKAGIILVCCVYGLVCLKSSSLCCSTDAGKNNKKWTKSYEVDTGLFHL